MNVVVRAVRPSDHAFIFATWLRQLWFSKDNNTLLPKAMFMKLQHKRLEAALQEQPGIVVCVEEDPDVIYGYKVGDFVYFKKAFRGLGLENLCK